MNARGFQHTGIGFIPALVVLRYLFRADGLSRCYVPRVVTIEPFTSEAMICVGSKAALCEKGNLVIDAKDDSNRMIQKETKADVG